MMNVYDYFVAVASIAVILALIVHVLVKFVKRRLSRLEKPDATLSREAKHNQRMEAQYDEIEQIIQSQMQDNIRTLVSFYDLTNAAKQSTKLRNK